MAGRTNTDAIRELEQAVATLTERIDNSRRDMERLIASNVNGGTRLQEVADALAEIRTRFALQQQQIVDLKLESENRDQKRWGLILAIFSALLLSIGSITAVLLQKYLP